MDLNDSRYKNEIKAILSDIPEKKRKKFMQALEIILYNNFMQGAIKALELFNVNSTSQPDSTA